MVPSLDRLHGWRIIVTDDDTSKLFSVTQTLRDAGMCVFAAYDGQSALELVIELPFVDLLVTNTRVPSARRSDSAWRPSCCSPGE